MNRPGKPASWRLMGGIQGMSGYAYGCKYPSLVFSLEGNSLGAAQQRALWSLVEGACPGIQKPAEWGVAGAGWVQTIGALLSVWQAVQSAVGLPVFEPGRVLVSSGTQARCVLPCMESSQRALASLVRRTLWWLAHPAADGAPDDAQTLFLQDVNMLGRFSASGSNVPRFVRAAYETDIPFFVLPGDVYQYGQGSRARWMDSSFTDVTPAISAKLARNKVLASALLRQSGVPVPSHQLAGDVETALQVAKRLGYPVVVKPADLDGGLGVAAGLCSEEEVRQAFAQARQLSQQILVEKHVEGRDYRLTVFNGEVIWAIERVPAGVTGDGLRTVAQLIDQVNADPRRGSGAHAPLKRLELDQEALALLGGLGLTTDSVPEDGRFVRLCRAANVASGGTPKAVFDRVHPDNAWLAVRATEALRLDLAGVDMLIPDIAVSWRESGAAICEVNGQPNLGQTTAAHLYAPMLGRLLQGSGRIPVVMVMGAVNPETWVGLLEQHWKAKGLRVGVTMRDHVRVNGETVHQGPLTVYTGGRMLALSRRVDAMLLVIGDDSVLTTGLPVDRCDVLILAGDHIDALDPKASTHRSLWYAELLRCVVPSCAGAVAFRASAFPASVNDLKRLTPAVWQALSNDDTEAIRQTVQLMEMQVAPFTLVQEGSA